MTASWLQTAVQSHRVGQLNQAKALCQQIIQAEPNHADALHLLALVFHQQGAVATAIEHLQKAIQARPQEPIFYCNLGIMLLSQGQVSEAIACYKKEILLKPQFADAYCRLGTALRIAGQYEEAVHCLQSAIQLQPGFAEAYNNLGNTLQDLRQLDAAKASYLKALAINPNFADAHNNLGKVLLDEERHDEAIAAFQTAVKLKPNLVIAYRNLGKVLLMQGYFDLAKEAYMKSQTLQPNNGTAIKLALMLPPIMGSKSEILSQRSQMEQALDQLVNEVTIEDPIREDCLTNFHLAYHGLNDLHIQRKIASFYEKVCPSLLYIAPHCVGSNYRSGKIRLGFVSKYIENHSVSLSYKTLIDTISGSDKFDIFLISESSPSENQEQPGFSGFSGQHVHIRHDLAAARERISTLELDILVYMDIGMEPMSYFLAFSRLAPVQCVLAGHPDTTGIGALDYYLSADSAEPHDADEHYSEKLVRLPFGFFYFNKPVKRNIDLRRENYFLPSSGSIYLCPVTLFKIHPDFDAAIERILEKDPNGFVVFVADKKVPALKDMLSDRFNKTIKQRVRDRAIFIPWVEGKDAFMGLIELADVVLDPFHFGIGSTGIPIFAVGTPYVTLPSKFMRGRVGLYFYELTGVRDCIALDLDDYVNKAVRIANDHSERDRIKSLILANNDVLFENPRAGRDFVGFVQDVTGNQN